ncbi:MAG: hypothetical protein OXK73_04020 [Rhodospirillaceae bacterium]|nr:hypothetical protein [Rhodospirillaceae bacterium]
MEEINEIKQELAVTRALVVALAAGLISEFPERKLWSLDAIDAALGKSLSPQCRDSLIRLHEDIRERLESLLRSRD